jgi:hypothetical protein
MTLRIKIDSNKMTPKNQLLTVLLVSFATISLIIIFGKLFIHPFLDFIGSDDKAYFEMAENIFEPVASPWTYRILTPLLVYLLPFETLVGFIIVNLSSFYATTILFYFYLRKLGFNFKISLIGVLLFILNPITIFLIYAICFVDLLLIFLFLLAFYAILCKNDVLFIISVTLGVANKEIILITLILFFFYKLHDKKFISTIKYTILVSILPVTVFFLIRVFVDGNSSYFSLDTILNVLSVHLECFQISVFFHPYRFYLVFGILWLISLIIYFRIDNFFLKKTIFLLPLIFLQALIATGYSRLFFIAFPIIIPLSLHLFKINYSKKYLIIILISSIILVFLHFFGLLYFYETSTFSSIMDFNSYFYWIFLNIIYGIFTSLILVYIIFYNSSKEKI